MVGWEWCPPPPLGWGGGDRHLATVPSLGRGGGTVVPGGGGGRGVDMVPGGGSAPWPQQHPPPLSHPLKERPCLSPAWARGPKHVGVNPLDPNLDFWGSDLPFHGPRDPLWPELRARWASCVESTPSSGPHHEAPQKADPRVLLGIGPLVEPQGAPPVRDDGAPPGPGMPPGIREVRRRSWPHMPCHGEGGSSPIILPHMPHRGLPLRTSTRSVPNRCGCSTSPLRSQWLGFELKMI